MEALAIKERSELEVKYGITELSVKENSRKWSSHNEDSYYSHEQTTAKALSVLCRGLEHIFEHEYGGWSWSSKLQRGINCGFGYSVSMNPDFAYPKTVEGVRAAVEEMIKECQREQQEEYDYDPDFYIKYNKTNPHEEHPWGDTADMLRAWLYADPFEWFCVHQELSSWAKYLVEESLFDIIADPSEGTSLSEALQKRFGDLMNKFIQDYEQSQ